ncbi:GGDEF domain-containing protein [Corallincola platygyrae]|uniref:diguanylate cyclase n=1 Tax=Corallincola platygyrae TaxID=1193278 RepID=A0ABW4XLB7_9GAMM
MTRFSIFPAGNKQRALTERFLLSASAYVVGISLAWIATAFELAEISTPVLVWSTGIISFFIVGMYFLYRFGANNNIEDSVLTRLQMLAAIGWSSFFIFHTQELRGAFLMVYLFITMFSFFTLNRAQTVLIAFLIAAAYGWVILFDWVRQTPGFNLQVNLLQWVILSAVLVWLCAIAGYMTHVREKVRKSSIKIQQQNALIKEANQELEQALAKMELMANTDELTGIGNRHYFRQQAHSMVKQQYVDENSFAVCLVDVDHFKCINDQYGHHKGDRALKQIARELRVALPDETILARFGGEEFVVLLPNAALKSTMEQCEKMRTSIEQYRFSELELSAPLTVSIGATLFCSGDNLDSALRRADQSLYKAKEAGRNKCAYDFSLDPSLKQDLNLDSSIT